MKKIILVLSLLTPFIFSFTCQRFNEVAPIYKHKNVLTDNSLTCEEKTTAVKNILVYKGGKWSVTYLVDSSDTRILIPGLVSNISPNTVVFKTDSLTEVNSTNNLIDVGAYIIENSSCGSILNIHSTLSGPNGLDFTFSEVETNSFKSTFYGPLGVNGSFIKVKFNGVRI